MSRPNIDRVDMVIARHLPTWVAWPVLSVAIVLGMLVGTIYGELISFYRTHIRGSSKGRT